MTLDAYAKEQFRERIEKLDERIEAADHNADEDAIHDLRVAIRRFSQTLIVFGSLLPKGRTKTVRRKLKTLMKAAGKVRNPDVALEAIGPRAPAGLRKALKTLRSKATAQLGDRLNRAARKDWTAKWNKRLSFRRSDRTVGMLEEEILQSAEQKFLLDGDEAAQAGTGSQALHKFRIATKRLRYTTELFAPLDKPAFAERIDAMRELQQILGDIHDCAVNAEIVRGLGAPVSIERRLLMRQRRHTASFRREWPRIRIVLSQAHRVEQPVTD